MFSFRGYICEGLREVRRDAILSKVGAGRVTLCRKGGGGRRKGELVKMNTGYPMTEKSKVDRMVKKDGARK